MEKRVIEGQKIKCDCCGTETLAEIRENKLVIIDRRHGRRHIVVLTITDLMRLMHNQIIPEA